MAGARKKEDGKVEHAVNAGGRWGLRHPLTAAAWILVPAAVAAAYLSGTARLWEYAASKREYAVARAGWSDSRTGAAWMPRRDAAALDEIASSARGRQPFESGLGEELARKFAANPWVECVEEVRCTFGRPSSAHVDVRLRVPFVLAAGSEGSAAVADRMGTIVPLSREDARRLGLPTVRIGKRIDGIPGERLKDRAALDAISALCLVADRLASFPQGKSLRIAEVRTEASETGTRLSFLTASGAAIEWGEFSAEPAWGEPTTRRKLELLESRTREITDWSRVERLRLDHETAPMKLRDMAPAGPAAPRSASEPRSNSGR